MNLSYSTNFSLKRYSLFQALRDSLKELQELQAWNYIGSDSKRFECYRLVYLSGVRIVHQAFPPPFPLPP